jgi:hypothetical protein
MGWQNLLLCKCVSDSINIHGALQSAYLGAKPNLDVLSIVILMLV